LSWCLSMIVHFINASSHHVNDTTAPSSTLFIFLVVSVYIIPKADFIVLRKMTTYPRYYTLIQLAF
jgi:hypothetical protein